MPSFLIVCGSCRRSTSVSLEVKLYALQKIHQALTLDGKTRIKESTNFSKVQNNADICTRIGIVLSPQKRIGDLNDVYFYLFKFK